MTSQDNNVYNLSDSGRSGKSKKRRVIRPGMKLLTALAAFMLLYMLFSFGANFNRLHSMQQDVEKIQSQIDELQKKNNDLRQQLKMAQSDVFWESGKIGRASCRERV